MSGWPAVDTVTVELVPAEHRHGMLEHASWTVVRRLPDGTQLVYPPEGDERRAHPVAYGLAVADEQGALFLPPPRWLMFCRLAETVWAAWDSRRCAPHGVLNCRADSCRDDDSDITEYPVPQLPARLVEVPVHA